MLNCASLSLCLSGIPLEATLVAVGVAVFDKHKREGTCVVLDPLSSEERVAECSGAIVFRAGARRHVLVPGVDGEEMDVGYKTSPPVCVGVHTVGAYHTYESVRQSVAGGVDTLSMAVEEVADTFRKVVRRGTALTFK
ncbi:hypothetical protein KIPB_005316 [Kipferlia bialata]|uniref:Uncharacterized protein n=1 Tax=Kipferlia bialata TaxID=797122 RepID=A0A9K3CVE1_9EUKA|nr:hypothetical protein KIPB_005316 [Kipferlia bialata]|eukprot:g5316.t1